MPEHAPEHRALLNRAAAYESWARTDDRTARTEPGRRALLAKFEREVDPDNILTAAERTRRAEFARKAFYTRLAARSAEVRRRRTSGGATCP